MGPIGILCVQRTLNKGRHSGFFTGVGAAASDLFYCLLTGLGISLVTDFIADHVNVLQIVGSVILIVYALYMIALRGGISSATAPLERQSGSFPFPRIRAEKGRNRALSLERQTPESTAFRGLFAIGDPCRRGIRNLP